MDKLRGVGVTTGAATTTLAADNENTGGGLVPGAEVGPLSTGPASSYPALVEASVGPSMEQSPMAHLESSLCGLSYHTLVFNANEEISNAIDASLLPVPVGMEPATQSSSLEESVAPQTVSYSNSLVNGS
ncbi:hypothetical protein V6N13_009168 [Hibiscus sabdariffa]|uniref:Uncharacterized protein n=2 Tax=Hibiscus sabdariffa TaxID=183260 RepID=A0ABR2DHC5_9ROSI